jgi:hypothetical protein
VLWDHDPESNEFSNHDYFPLDADSFKSCADNEQSPFGIDGSTMNADSFLPLSDMFSDPTKAIKSVVITQSDCPLETAGDDFILSLLLPQVDIISNPKSELECVTSQELAVNSDDCWLTTVPDDLLKSSLPVISKSSSSSSMASIQSHCHPTLLKTTDTMADPLSYGVFMIDGLSGTKVLISLELIERDELNDSIIEQHLQLVTSSDSDATVLPFNRGPAKVLTTSARSLELLPFDHGPTSCLSILLSILQAVPRFAFEDMKVCFFLHLGFISYFILLGLKALPTLAIKQAICGLLLGLTLFSF